MPYIMQRMLTTQQLHSSTEVLADKFGQYFGVLLEYPDDEGWQESTAELLKAMVEARGKMKFEQKREERRGDFDTIAFGVSYGGGQTVSTAVFACHTLLMSAHSVQETSSTAHTTARSSRSSCGTRTWSAWLNTPAVRPNSLCLQALLTPPPSCLRRLLPRPLRRVRQDTRQPL